MEHHGLILEGWLRGEWRRGSLTEAEAESFCRCVQVTDLSAAKRRQLSQGILCEPVTVPPERGFCGGGFIPMC